MPALAALYAQGRRAPREPGGRSRPVRHASYWPRARPVRRARRYRPPPARARTRSLSAASMRWSASARRARSSVATGSVRWLRSAIVRSASVRRVSIAMRALRPSAPGSRVRSHSSAKRSVSRCRQIRPSMRSAQRPSAGRARAQRRARGIKGERSPPRERTQATISSMEAPSSIAAATASWIAPGSGSSDEPPPIAPAVLRSLSHCVAGIRAREDDRRMARSWRARSAPCTARWSVARARVARA